MSVIEVTDLSKQYGKNKALKNVSFEIGEHEIVGFIGPNGAGKSTTMNILCGYLAPTSGTVKVCGILPTQDPMEARKHIGYLPEIPPLYVDMTVEEQVRFACKLSGVPYRGKELTDYVLKLLDKTHVTHMRRRLIRNLSKGYRQRVAVAQLLAGDPKILILDEPTVGLDPRQIREFRDLFLELGKEHTVIFSSHILSEINSICSRVFIFEQGEILADGKPEELQQMLSDQNTLCVRLRKDGWVSGENGCEIAADASVIEGLKAQLEAIPEVKSVRTNAIPGSDAVEFHITYPSAGNIASNLNACIRNAECEILLMQPEALSLEDIYLGITEKRRQA